VGSRNSAGVKGRGARMSDALRNYLDGARRIERNGDDDYPGDHILGPGGVHTSQDDYAPEQWGEAREGSPAVNEKPARKPKEQPAFARGLIDSRTFAATEYKRSWLVTSALVEGQFSVLAGALKDVEDLDGP
jgi:hypothetical protein